MIHVDLEKIVKTDQEHLIHPLFHPNDQKEPFVWVKGDGGPSRIEGLDPDSDPSMMANFLKVYDDDIMLVGHLPHQERLASVLLTGNPDRCPVRFRNGGVVCLEKDNAGNWSILWAVIPELLHAWKRLAA